MKLKRTSINTNYWTLYDDDDEPIRGGIWLGILSNGLSFIDSDSVSSNKYILTYYMYVSDRVVDYD